MCINIPHEVCIMVTSSFLINTNKEINTSSTIDKIQIKQTKTETFVSSVLENRAYIFTVQVFN